MFYAEKYFSNEKIEFHNILVTVHRIFYTKASKSKVIIVPNRNVNLTDLLNMTCKDCGKDIGYTEHKESMDSLGVELCARHTKLIKKVILNHNTSLEAIQLYYELKKAGLNPMLEWWDGKKYVDIAISRAKLNIEIDTDSKLITHEQAINDLEQAMHSFKEGFTTVRIPSVAVKHYMQDTVKNILGIVEGLRKNIKVIS